MMDTSSADSHVSPEHLKSMKSAIHSFLQDTHVYDSIRDIVDTYISQHEGESLQQESPGEIMRVIREKGVLQELVSQIQTRSVTAGTRTPSIPNDGRF